MVKHMGEMWEKSYILTDPFRVVVIKTWIDWKSKKKDKKTKKVAEVLEFQSKFLLLKTIIYPQNYGKIFNWFEL